MMKKKRKKKKKRRKKLRENFSTGSLAVSLRFLPFELPSSSLLNYSSRGK